jgi:hypothetical protein
MPPTLGGVGCRIVGFAYTCGGGGAKGVGAGGGAEVLGTIICGGSNVFVPTVCH